MKLFVETSFMSAVWPSRKSDFPEPAKTGWIEMSSASSRCCLKIVSASELFHFPHQFIPSVRPTWPVISGRPRPDPKLGGCCRQFVSSAAAVRRLAQGLARSIDILTRGCSTACRAQGGEVLPRSVAEIPLVRGPRHEHADRKSGRRRKVRAGRTLSFRDP